MSKGVAAQDPAEARTRSASGKGQLIVATGLLSCGKSTVFKELGRIWKVKTFLEPEERVWPDAVRQRNVAGFFTALGWFRASRVPLLFQASLFRDKGETVLMDSYYDKLLTCYLGKKGMEWLFPPDDTYFDLARRLALLDWEHLPDADCVVAFELDKDEWVRLLGKRGRSYDRESRLSETFYTQDYFIGAGRQYCESSGAKFVIFKQEYSTPKRAAELLDKTLRENGIHP